MANPYKGTFLMRDLSTALQSLAPRDKILIAIEGTNDSGSDHDVDLSDILTGGATVHYIQFKEKALTAAGLLDSEAAIPAASSSVMTLVVANQKDLKMDG